ncbi:ABC transporter permease [Portibacter marinus]|uniref:ABC transporter permease n=1 Tax=Portibacter marinus TaxID=2898660 RepID=UPI001F36D566|nr:ABC transporter permease [Portibacter marinus]
MLNSIFKKLLGGLVSLLLISVLIFLLSKAVPGDPVNLALGVSSESEINMNYQEEYERKKRELKLHLPYFYFSFLPYNFPANLQMQGSLIDIRNKRRSLMEESNLAFPKFHWNGTENQYHNWLFSSSVSLQDGKPVRYKIGRAIVWTLFLVVVSVFFSYSLGILMGLFLSGLSNQKLRSWLEAILIALYAIPVFWMATLLLVFFTTSEYGTWTNIFPSVGLAPIDLGEPWYVRIGKFGAQLILPCFVLVLHNLAFLSMLTKRNLDKNKRLGFVTTSKVFGFGEKEIIFKEVLPLSLIPLITSVSSAIPSAVGGSLVVEIIFNIPGMGRLLYTSIMTYDWPVVFPIVLLIAIITYISFFLADILYRIADPRIR